MYFLEREKIPKSARGDRIRIDDCHPGPPQLTPQLCLYADFALYCLAGAFRYALKLPSARCGFAQFCASAAIHHLLTDSKGEEVFQPRGLTKRRLRWFRCDDSYGGGVQRGSNTQIKIMRPPLALVRSCGCTTSAVNACVDSAKPLTALSWQEPICFFLGSEKEVIFSRVRNHGKSHIHPHTAHPSPPKSLSFHVDKPCITFPARKKRRKQAGFARPQGDLSTACGFVGIFGGW